MSRFQQRHFSSGKCHTPGLDTVPLQLPRHPKTIVRTSYPRTEVLRCAELDATSSFLGSSPNEKVTWEGSSCLLCLLLGEQLADEEVGEVDCFS